MALKGAPESWGRKYDRFGFYDPLKCFPYWGFVDKLFGVMGSFHCDLPRRKGMQRDVKGKSMPIVLLL